MRTLGTLKSVYLLVNRLKSLCYLHQSHWMGRVIPYIANLEKEIVKGEN